MFGLLMIFGQIRGEPCYGENSGLIEGLTTGVHHIKLTWCHLLSVPGTITAQMHTGTGLNLRDKPQGASCGHDHTKRVRPDDALSFATLSLPQPLEGVGVAYGNFCRPAVAILNQDVVHTQGQIGGEKGFDRGGGGFLWPGFLAPRWPSRRSTTTRISRPGNPACQSPHQAWTLAPSSLGWGNQP